MKKQFLSLSEIHAALFEILVEFDRVCREYNLRYSLDYGTLLGAVRHKGFIPWDDDVDVSMPRSDYERFLTLVNEGQIRFASHFMLSRDRGRGADYPYLKLMDTRYKTSCFSHFEVPYLFLDIFPVDGVPDLPEKQVRRWQKKVDRYNFVIGVTRWYTFNSRFGFIAWILGFWYYLPFVFYGRKRAAAKLQALAKNYPFEKCSKVDVGWGLTHDYVERECFEHYCEVEFAGRKFMAISDWDKRLTVRYGDYMTPPKKIPQISGPGTIVYKNPKYEKEHS